MIWSPRLVVSVVSHAQYSLVSALLADLQNYCSKDIDSVILTLNVDEQFDQATNNYDFPVHVVSNNAPRGFGANHNAAFSMAQSDYYCVLNPDIRLTCNPFPALLELAAQPSVGVVASRIISVSGQREDSSRCFPSLSELLMKLVGGKSASVPDGSDVSRPDWVAGMFMLFPSHVYRQMNGFDEKYFLYYEDVDLCARLALAGYDRLVCQEVAVVHDARRSSHRSWRFAAMHLRSIFRFFSSDVYRQIRKLQRSSLPQPRL